MEENILFDRKEAVKKAQEESERSDLKQHADKMLRDFEKFNDFSSNRAIWELVQNACDLTTNCQVILDYRNGKFSFTHNGRPFNSNSLVSLIKQVSGDKDESSEIPPVGKYGTGFLTTHSLGRKFLIDSVLESSGTYIEIKDFLVDRSSKKWEDLSEQIRLQKNRVFEIIETGKIIENPELSTTFTYLPETEQEKKYVTESYRDLDEYIPIVLTINNRLKYVKVISIEGSESNFTLLSKEQVFNEKEIGLYKTSINKNGEEKIIYSIADISNEIEIILPINKDLTLFEFPERVARLFLYYPLIGSEDFGINFIINCNRFLPTEPRDGIHLKSNKDQVKDQEEANRLILEKASDLLFQFLNSNVLTVKNPLLYANIDFKRNTDNTLLNEYFIGLQEEWVNNFKSLEIVDTKDGYKEASEVTFLNPELLKKKEYFDDIYYLVDKFFSNMPSKQTIEYWSIYVDKWDNDEFIFLNNEDIVKKIEECSLVDFDETLLKKYYDYLLEEKRGDLFTSYKLLPNLDGTFQSYSNLRQGKDINDQLIEIGKKIMPHSISQLIDERFKFDFNFDIYHRKDFSNSINNKLNEILSDNHLCFPSEYDVDLFVNWDESIYSTFDIDSFEALLSYCKLTNNINSQSKPNRLMVLISDYYNVKNNLIYIDSVDNKEDDLDVRQVQKKVVKLFFNTILHQTSSWIESHIRFIFDVISCYEDRYKEVFLTSKIYPNQLYTLRNISELKKDIDLKEEIIELYNKVTKSEIRAILAHRDFNNFLVENDIIDNKYLSKQIEDVFLETDINDINEHSFKEDIINIISKLNNPFYKDLFQRLDDRKANLMLEIVTNQDTKDDIFSIVRLKEDQLKKLGKLVQLPNFDEILSKAEDVVRLEKERNSDFQHKHKIGTYIERKIREKLSSTITSKLVIDKEKRVDAEDVQGGQDIIIYYNGDPVYFIEVKSRWDSRNSVTMSKLQLERASDNADKYALISVDITKYHGKSDRYELLEEEVISLAKAINNIGQDITPLISNNLIAERDYASRVKLTDYRGVVNQDFINMGDNFESFVDSLIKHLESII
ncbi:DUF3883 domain-containing protein [Sphingobacterium thalpophilum]|uniref:DUF3883 domain-containing protein n=1 Tax=Sphingobacterium thalpophilum TaxID=259 RepID=A0ABV4HKK2_9SPHI